MKCYKHLIICALLFSLSSCQPIIRLMIGAKNPKPHSVEDIRKWAVKLNLEHYPVYSLDTSFFTDLSGIYDSLPVVKNALVQPAQIYCFDAHGQLLSMSTNCYYPGILKTKWNSYGSFDSFPVMNRLDTTLLNSFSFLTMSKFLHPVNNHSYDASKEMVVLFMNESFMRMAKTLSRMTLNHFPDKQLIIVNTDDYIYHLSDGTIVNQSASKY